MVIWPYATWVKITIFTILAFFTNALVKMTKMVKIVILTQVVYGQVAINIVNIGDSENLVHWSNLQLIWSSIWCVIAVYILAFDQNPHKVLHRKLIVLVYHDNIWENVNKLNLHPENIEVSCHQKMHKLQMLYCKEY